MSKKWIINREGNVAGPLSTEQLQQMVATGTLQAHHMVREEKSPRWATAGTIRGLFAPLPVAEPEAVAPVEPAALAKELPFATWDAAPVESNAFDFFSAPPAQPPVPPAPVAEVTPPPKPVAEVKPPPKHVSPLLSAVEEVAPAPPNAGDDNPFSFGPTVSPRPQKAGPRTPSTPIPAVKVEEPAPIVAAETPAAAIERDERNPFAFAPRAAKGAQRKPKAESVEIAPPPPFLEEAAALETATAPGAGATAAAAATQPAVVEISGQAVDLLPDETIRLHDGKTTLRLSRAWLSAVTKYKDGSQRMAYLRLQRIDAASIDSRFEIGRGRVTPHPVLVFQAGQAAVGVVVSGGDKAARSFIERVLLQASVPVKSGGK